MCHSSFVIPLQLINQSLKQKSLMMAQSATNSCADGKDRDINVEEGDLPQDSIKSDDGDHHHPGLSDETSEGATQESHGEKGAAASNILDCLSINNESAFDKEDLLDHLKGVIYGNCIGDAIGLLTEFMSKKEAYHIYVEQKKHWLMKKIPFKKVKIPSLEYPMKHDDIHRYRWETGDWTDDSDQMILILQTLLENDGKMVECDFASKLRQWSQKGFPELGDCGGMGLGRTTSSVLRHPEFLLSPHQAARDVWEKSGKTVAPNGGVMRTSILGTHNFGNINTVIENTKTACKVTHADPRCVASCVAVTTAIATMLQGKYWTKSAGFDVEAIAKVAYEHACSTLETDSQKEELRDYMYKECLEGLKLGEAGKIGYTYKCLGTGFWSLRQTDFRASLEAITLEGGDADTNGAVAGALLGCRLGSSALPTSWLQGLKHKAWLDDHIARYIKLLGLSE